MTGSASLRNLMHGVLIALAVVLASPARGERKLYNAQPDAWHAAVDAYNDGHYADALIRFAALDREEREHAQEADSVIPLARYFLLQCLLGLEREEDLVARIQLLEPGRLPPAFQREAQILQLQVDLIQDRAPRVAQVAGSLLQTENSPSQESRLSWLHARALTGLDREEEAIDPLVRCITLSDINTAQERLRALQELTRILETVHAGDEAEAIRRLQSEVNSSPPEI